MEGFNDSNGNLIRGSPNLLVEKIHSIIALRISVFFSLSNVLSCNRVCKKEEWFILMIYNLFYSNTQKGVSFIIKCRTVEKKT